MYRKKENINELEDITMKVIKSEKQREKNRLIKLNRVPGTCRIVTKDLIFMSSESQNGIRKRMGMKKYSNK